VISDPLRLLRCSVVQEGGSVVCRGGASVG
jgi:hypothetical protein